MLVDAIATVILAGLLFVPLVNVVVGAAIGGGMAGAPGFVVGVFTAILITWVETWIADRLGWTDVRVDVDGVDLFGDEPATVTAGRIQVTGPPSRRRKLNPGRDARERPARVSTPAKVAPQHRHVTHI